MGLASGISKPGMIWGGGARSSSVRACGSGRGSADRWVDDLLDLTLGQRQPSDPVSDLPTRRSRRSVSQDHLIVTICGIAPGPSDPVDRPRPPIVCEECEAHITLVPFEHLAEIAES